MVKFKEEWELEEEVKPKKKKPKEKAKEEVIDLFLAGGSLLTVSLFFIFFSSSLISSWGRVSQSTLAPSEAEIINLVLLLGVTLLCIAIMFIVKGAFKLREYKSGLAKEGSGLPDWGDSG